MDSPSNGSQDESGAYSPRLCLLLTYGTLTIPLNYSSRPPTIPITAISRSVYPTPDSSILLDLDAPACKRLTSRAFSPHEVIPLIEAIFTNQNEVKMIGFLRGDEAQTFIDVIHEVRLRHPSFPRRGLISSCLSVPNFHSPLIRLWISPISRHGSGGSV